MIEPYPITVLDYINLSLSITYSVHFEGGHFDSKLTKDKWAWISKKRNKRKFLMTQNKGTRKHFGHLKVTEFEDLKIYDNIHD